jgi:hypothetical protein
MENDFKTLMERLETRANELEKLHRYSDRARMWEMAARLMDKAEELDRVMENAEKLLAAP